jgi:diguanylate cyclase (GGDEF)-like protein
MQLLDFLENSSKVVKIIIGFLLVAIVGFLNLLAGWEIDFSLFYLIPIAYTSWFLNFRLSSIVCIVCITVWFYVDLSLLHKYSSEFIHYWNTIIRFLFFILFSFLLNSLKVSHVHEKLLARTDGLTGVANSRYFYKLLEMEIEHAKRFKHPLTLAYIDMDNFKIVNDHLGHSKGDDALKIISNYFKKNLRTIDIVGRLGGDEFALFFPETDQNTVRIIINNLQKGLLFEMQQNNWPITFSIGVLTCVNVYPDVDDFIKSVDKLMYDVKNTTKNSVKYDNYKG